MRKNNLAFIDLETTGLSMVRHEIIEIGCILTTPDLEVIEEIDIKVKPERIQDADPVSLKVNQYDPKKWQEAISLGEAIKIISQKTAGCVMVGQNVSFDYGFLEAAFTKTENDNLVHRRKLDTISIAWAKLQKEEKINEFSLHEMCAYFKIKNEREHSALSDARATFELYKKLRDL